MISLELINQIKKITITSLVQDDDFLETLVLKGGNALSMGYGLSERASYDLDYSMEADFQEEITVIESQLKELLKNGFIDNGYIVLDFKMNPKPKVLKEDLVAFWGGYYVEFKLTTKKEYDRHYPDMAKIRRSALALNPDNSTKFSIDISKHEYIGTHRIRKEFDQRSSSSSLSFAKARIAAHLASKAEEYESVVRRVRSAGLLSMGHLCF